MIKFNVNGYVMVKLTSIGRKEIIRRHMESKKDYPKMRCNFSLPLEDEDGWSKWQLHELMEQLGHLCYGCNVPFEPNMKILNEVKQCL